MFDDIEKHVALKYYPIKYIPSKSEILDMLLNELHYYKQTLWQWASDLSLILRRYNGSTVAMGRSRPSLLWSVAATSTVMIATHRYCSL
jgi:hypothetical protein